MIFAKHYDRFVEEFFGIKLSLCQKIVINLLWSHKKQYVPIPVARLSLVEYCLLRKLWRLCQVGDDE